MKHYKWLGHKPNPLTSSEHLFVFYMAGFVYIAKENTDGVYVLANTSNNQFTADEIAKGVSGLENLMENRRERLGK